MSTLHNTQTLRSLLGNCTLPANEARILLSHVLENHYQLPRSALLSRDDMVIDGAAFVEWEELKRRRIDGEPIAYLLGKKGFHAIELLVAPGVLIPRPETELLVDIALAEIEQLKRPGKILDLGTGSGAIALAIGKALPQAKILATDQSSDALAIAKKNALSLGLQERVQFAQGSWYDALPKASSSSDFDVIVSNPPYIANEDPHLCQGDLRFEPASALTDFGNGLTCLKQIISGAIEHLRPGGLITVEHGYDQSEAVVNMMNMAGLINTQVHLDLAGHTRAVSARRAP